MASKPFVAFVIKDEPMDTSSNFPQALVPYKASADAYNVRGDFVKSVEVLNNFLHQNLRHVL